MAAALALKAASVWAGTVVLNSEGLLATGPRAEATLAPRHVSWIIRDYLQPSHGGKSPQVSRGAQPACEFSKLSFHLSAHHAPIRACTQPSAGYPPPSHLLAVPLGLLATVRPPSVHPPSIRLYTQRSPMQPPPLHSPIHPSRLPTDLPPDQPPLPRSLPITQHSPYPLPSSLSQSHPELGVVRHPRGVHRLAGQEGIHGLGGQDWLPGRGDGI